MTYETAIVLMVGITIATLAYFGRNIDSDGIRNNLVLVVVKHFYLLMIPWVSWAGLGLVLRMAVDNSASQGVIDQLTIILTSTMWINILTLLVFGLFIFQQFIMKIVNDMRDKQFRL